mgnify:CR=1 FL=1
MAGVYSAKKKGKSKSVKKKYQEIVAKKSDNMPHGMSKTSKMTTKKAKKYKTYKKKYKK